MSANLAKRKIADPWMLEITTAPEPGTGSVAEAAMDYAEAVRQGTVTDASFFFFHRQAGDEHDLTTRDGAMAAVVEAGGSASVWRDNEAIVNLWNDPTTDRSFWERVWCNRLVKSSSQAFDVEKWKALAAPRTIPDGELITIGFDGSVFDDATAIVPTHIASGYQWLAGLWEKPPNIEGWRVPAEEVDRTMRDLFARFTVWKLYADPPYWTTQISEWSGFFGESLVTSWWTNRRHQMTVALGGFDSAIKQGLISHDGNKRFINHIGNARRENLNGQRDEQGKPLWLIRKDRHDSPLKMDAAMAAVLSWQARTDAIAAGALNVPEYQLIVLGSR